MPKILVVAQDLEAVQRIRTALSSRDGWEVEAAGSDAEARGAMGRRPPDLVVVATGVDGADELIRDQASGAGGPGTVALVPAGAGPALGAGADTVLRRPFGADELRRAVDRVLATKSRSETTAPEPSSTSPSSPGPGPPGPQRPSLDTPSPSAAPSGVGGSAPEAPPPASSPSGATASSSGTASGGDPEDDGPASKLTSIDIFGDLVAEMETDSGTDAASADEPGGASAAPGKPPEAPGPPSAPPPPRRPPAGPTTPPSRPPSSPDLDEDLDRRLEATLSGVLGKGGRPGTAAGRRPPAEPTSRESSPPEAPSPKPPAPEPPAAGPSPPEPTPPEAPPPSRRPSRSNADVDALISETLSGLTGTGKTGRGDGAPSPPPRKPPRRPATGEVDLSELEALAGRRSRRSEPPAASTSPTSTADGPETEPPLPDLDSPSPFELDLADEDDPLALGAAGDDRVRTDDAPDTPFEPPVAPEPPTAEAEATDEAAEPVARGTMFGQYELLERIGVGGMAEVWKARMKGVEGFQKTVAIKKILPHLTDSTDFVDMFVDEAKLAAQLNHNNIIHIYDLGKIGDDYYIAMEHVDGHDLRTILNTAREHDRPMPVALALHIAARLASALDHAHRKRDFEDRELGLVHRDVSPQNVLISHDGNIKLCDFGIVKAVSKSSHTQMGALKGKLQYMSPEQAWGRTVDFRSDIFSIGALLFEMLTGRRLFVGDSEMEVLEAVREAQVEPPSALRPEVPEEVDRLVLHALELDPADRPPSAGAQASAFEALIARLGSGVGTGESLSHYMAVLFRGAAPTPELEKPPVLETADADSETDETVEETPPPADPEAVGPEAAAPAAVASPEKTIRSTTPDTETPKAATPAAAPPPTVEAVEPVDDGEPVEGERRGRGLLIVVIVVLVLALAGLAWWYLLGPSASAGGASPDADAAPAASAGTPAPAGPTGAPTAGTETGLEDGVDGAAPVTNPEDAAPGAGVPDGEAAEDDPASLDPGEREERLRAQFEEARRREAAVDAPETADTTADAETGADDGAPDEPPADTGSADPADSGDVPATEPPVDILPTTRPEDAQASGPTAADRLEAARRQEAEPPPPAPEPEPEPEPEAAPAEPSVRVGQLVTPGPGVVPPRLVSFDKPEYPPMARRLQVEGTVVIAALVDENGRVAETRLEQSAPQDVGLDEAALAAARSARYRPATKDGVRVKMWTTLRIPFRL